MIARIAVLSPVDQLFDYLIPEALGPLVEGERIWAPWGKRRIEGVVVSLDPVEPADQLKAILARVDGPAIPAELLRLAHWISDYYAAPPGEVLQLFIPSSIRAHEKQSIRLTNYGKKIAPQRKSALLPPVLGQLSTAELQLFETVAGGVRSTDTLDARLKHWRESLPALVNADLVQHDTNVEAVTPEQPKTSATNGAEVLPDRPPILSVAQKAAFTPIQAAIAADRPEAFLLHGVTGAGKTEVYLHAIDVAIGRGKKALVLVPEIALTPQLHDRFVRRFGQRVAVLHSGLRPSEHRRTWEQMMLGEIDIVVGARSAVFSPLRNVGVIVLDEEHDASFKQQEGVRYHARDVALLRARYTGAVVVLGSATPSVEVFAAVERGTLRLLSLPERVTPQPLPQVEIIDLKKYILDEENQGILSQPLLGAIKDTLEQSEQAILFLNRRGFSTCLLCQACGRTRQCPNCSVALTAHRWGNRLVCHYCDYAVVGDKTCPACGKEAVAELGYGTEKIETILQRLFPQARVARFDRDTTRGTKLVKLIEDIHERRIDIVVGTQMVAKGHDFPSVTLVGVVLADLGMGLPDFRAAERTYQLLEQVAGRAGRRDRLGRVIIQTYNPDHPAIRSVVAHDYHGFVTEELANRREVGYPPAARLVCVHFESKSQAQVKQAAESLATMLRQVIKQESLNQTTCLGPVEAPIARIRGQFRWQLFLKADLPRMPAQLLHTIRNFKSSGVRVKIDVDPVSVL